MYNAWVLIDSYSGIDAACSLSLPCACSWAFERQSETLQRFLCPSWLMSILQYHTALQALSIWLPFPVYLSTLHIPVGTTVINQYPLPSCLLSGSAWLQTTLVFLVWAQTPIWAIPLVAFEGGCSLRVGIYQMLLRCERRSSIWVQLAMDFPPLAAHICSNTLYASCGSLNNFQTIKKFRYTKEIMLPTVLQSSQLFCIG